MPDAANEPELASPEVQRRRIVFTIVLISVIALILCAIAPFARHWLERRVTAAHQRSVTHSLADWEREDSQIHTPEDAEHARGMLEYIRGYYVVAPGYRSDPETEAALEAQRAKTICTIEKALEDFELSR